MGTVRAVAAEHRISWIRLEGGDEAVRALAVALAGEVHLAVPHACLAAEAFSLASGVAPPPRREGAPELPSELSVAEAFAYAVGHLSDVILHFARPLRTDAMVRNQCIRCAWRFAGCDPRSRCSVAW